MFSCATYGTFLNIYLITARPRRDGGLVVSARPMCPGESHTPPAARDGRAPVSLRLSIIQLMRLGRPAGPVEKGDGSGTAGVSGVEVQKLRR